MVHILFLYLFLLSVAIIALDDGEGFSGSVKLFVCIAMACVLVSFAGLRQGQYYHDYDTYIELFFSDGLRGWSMERSFMDISWLTKAVAADNYIVLFCIYAVLGVSIKFYALYKYARYFYLSLVLYLSTFYILHDLIQIRAGVSSAIMLLAVPFYHDRKYLLLGLSILLAYYFHASAIVLIALFLLSRDTMNIRLWTVVYIAAILINLLNIDVSSVLSFILSLVPSEILPSRISTYFGMMAHVDLDVKLLSPYILTHNLITFILLYNARRIYESTNLAYLLLKLQIISNIVYMLPIDGVSIRLSELLAVTSLYLYPLLVDCFEPRYQFAGRLAICLVAGFFMTFYIFNLRVISYI